MSDFGCRLREERERLGLNQEAFGAAGGVRKNAQSDYERDLRVPDCAYLAGVAGLGADVLYVVTGRRGDVPAALSADEAGLLDTFRRVTDDEKRKALVVVCRALAIREGGHG